MNKTILIFLSLFTFSYLNAFAEVKIPDFQSDVLDETSILTAQDQIELKEMIRQLRERDDVYLAIYFASSLQDTSIEDLANRTFSHWKLGQKGKDNGVLFLVVPSERKMRLEVGYGLEPIYTDSWTKGLQDDYIRPYFKNGDYFLGAKLCIEKLSKMAQLQRSLGEFPIAKEMVSTVHPALFEFFKYFAGLFFLTTLLHIIAAITHKIKNKAQYYGVRQFFMSAFMSAFFSLFMTWGFMGSNHELAYIAAVFCLIFMILPVVFYIFSPFFKTSQFNKDQINNPANKQVIAFYFNLFSPLIFSTITFLILIDFTPIWFSLIISGTVGIKIFLLKRKTIPKKTSSNTDLSRDDTSSWTSSDSSSSWDSGGSSSDSGSSSSGGDSGGGGSSSDW